MGGSKKRFRSRSLSNLMSLQSNSTSSLISEDEDEAASIMSSASSLDFQPPSKLDTNTFPTRNLDIPALYHLEVSPTSMVCYDCKKHLREHMEHKASLVPDDCHYAFTLGMAFAAVIGAYQGQKKAESLDSSPLGAFWGEMLIEKHLPTL